MKNSFKGFRKLLALAVSISMFACHNPSEIGYGIGGDADINALYTDTLNLDYATVLQDSSVNGNSAYILAGNANDPIFGPVKAIAYFTPSLTPLFDTYGEVITDNNSGAIIYDTLKYNANPILDSLKLRLYIVDKTVIGDSNAVNKYTIHRLKDVMKTTNYNSSEKLDYDPTPLAEFQFKIPDIRVDSVDVLLAQFVHLPKSLVQELLEVGAAANGDDKKFISKYKGFAIVPNATNKAVVSFSTGQLNVNGYNSSLISYWHNQGDTTSQLYVFNLNGPRYTHFEFNRSQTPLASLSKNQNELSIDQTQGKLYMQAGSGIATKVNFKNLDRLGKIRISRATLEFKVDPSSINGQYHRSMYQVLAEADAQNQQKRNSDNQLVYYNSTYNTTNITLGSVFALVDSSSYQNIDLTRYLQTLQKSGNNNVQFLLQPGLIRTSDGYGTVGNEQLNRLVFLRPRLLLYYTKE